MATLNKHVLFTDNIARADDTPLQSAPDEPVVRTARTRRRSAPRSPVAYASGMAIVCTLAALQLVVGEPAASATATSPELSASASVADALGIDAADPTQRAVEDRDLLEQLAASRAERDAEQAAAVASQAQAEKAAAEAKKAAEAKAAAEAKKAAEAKAAAEAKKAAEAKAAAEAKKAAEAKAAAEAAAPSGTAVTTVASISNTAGPVAPQVQAAANAVVSNVPGAAAITIGGTRASAADPGGHPSGLALDYMVMSDAALGDAITQYHIDHWDELGVDYIIWQQRILNSPGGSWEYMDDRGSATANHMDHPHVNYLG